jgi:hypothetical protein
LCCLCSAQKPPPLVLVADRLEDSKKALEDVDDHGDHSCLDDSFTNMFCSPDSDVDDALEGEGPFEAVLAIVDFGVLEDGDETFESSVAGDVFSDGRS